MKLPVLSIVIPTKNRVPYCIAAIESILSFSFDDFELIIQDNTDNYELQNYVKNRVNDPRLVYRYEPKKLSSIGNIDASVELASGEYVCMLGDDDSVLASLFEAVRWANQNNIDSICPQSCPDYFWPDALSAGSKGKLIFPNYTGSIRYVDPKVQLLKLFKKGIINYLGYGLPKMYHGIVRRKYLIDIKNKTGHFFGGLSPDIYGVVTLSSCITNHIVLDYPLTIAGACNASTSAGSKRGFHRGKLEEAPHFKYRGEYNWDPLVPAFYSVETIWAESALTAARELGEVELRKQFNYNHFVARAIIHNLRIWRMVISKSFFTKRKEINFRYLRMVISLFLFVSIIVSIIFKRLARKCFKQNEIIEFNDTPNIKEALICMEDFVLKRKLSISVILLGLKK